MSTHDATQPTEFDIDSARLAPAPDEDDHGEGVLRGGDAAKAPHSLTAPELRPMAGDSSGTGWDDPAEL